MRTEALLADYASKYSFHGLDLVFYMQDETRYKLTPQDKMTAASFQNLLDTFVRSGSTKTVNKFSVSVPASAFTAVSSASASASVSAAYAHTLVPKSFL